jgi:hypothetical protein
VALGPLGELPQQRAVEALHVFKCHRPLADHLMP